LTLKERRRGQRPGHHDQLPATNNERPLALNSGAADKGLGDTAKYLRRTTSAAAGNGLGTTTMYLNGAAANRLGTTVKYLRRTSSGAADNGLGTTIE
jgi:hypothetical protein